MNLFKKMAAKFKMDERGFTLPEVMIGAAITSVIALAVVSTAKNQATNAINSQMENEITQVSAQILSILNSPPGCNANFRNSISHPYITTSATLATYPYGIYRCKVGTCASTILATTETEEIYPIYTSDFLPAHTKMSGKVRLKSIQYTLGTTPTGYNSLSSLNLTLTFEKSANPSAATPIITPVVKNFSIPLLVQGSTVAGCTRNTNSTTIY